MAKTRKVEEKRTDSDQIRDLEKEIANTKYNKRTQHAIGLMKAKLAALKDKKEKRAGIGGSEYGFAVRKSGDATVLLLGFPSAGKSTLLNQITGAKSETAAYAFTTLTVVPGTLKYKGAEIQILDVPGIVAGAAAGTGRGKEVLQVLRNSDLVIILIDVNTPEHLKKLLKEVNDAHIRINQRKPDVRIRKTIRGGVRVGRTVRTPELTDEDIKSILHEFRISNADVLIREVINADQLIDVIAANKHYVPAILIANKIDMASDEQLLKIEKELHPDLLVSASEGRGVEELKEMIFRKLRFMRIFLKEVGKKPDMEEPMIMFEGSTIRNLCDKLHKDFVKRFKHARIWGKTAKFDGQHFLKLDKELHDRDIVELHLR